MKKQKVNEYTIKLTEADDIDMADAYIDAMKCGEEPEEVNMIHIYKTQDGKIVAFREIEERIHAQRTFAKLTRDMTYFSEFLQKYGVAQ